jgi:hypothetical protein
MLTCRFSSPQLLPITAYWNISNTLNVMPPSLTLPPNNHAADKSIFDIAPYLESTVEFLS